MARSKRGVLFTSESVTEGHPDKVADQISDAILDAMLEQDPMSRVACETMVSTGMCVVSGEITTKADVDIPAIVRKTICDIGYIGGGFRLRREHLRRDDRHRRTIARYCSRGGCRTWPA